MKNFTKRVKLLDKHFVRLNRLICLDVCQSELDSYSDHELYSYSDHEREEMVEKLHDLSLTHKVYEIDDVLNSDTIYINISKSSNGRTNIDCDFIQACLDYLVRDEE